MKKIIFIIVLALFISAISFTGCGSANDSTGSNQTSGSYIDTADQEPLTDNEIQQMYSDPDSFKGRKVTLTGVVFAQVERDNDAVYFQMNQDIQNYDNNTVVAYQDPQLALKDGDYIRLTGTVKGTFEGENAFGGTVTAPQILADQCEVIDYKEAAVPTLKEIAVNKTADQYGYSVTVDKVELAAAETRVYVTVTNNGGSNFSLYSFNCNLLQGSTQYDYQTNYKADYPEIQTDLIPGMESSGIICFPTIDPDKPFTLILDGNSDNYFDENFQPYRFDIQ